jgi:hypothetical protein
VVRESVGGALGGPAAREYSAQLHRTYADETALTYSRGGCRDRPLVSSVSCSRLLTIRAIFLSDGAFGEPNEAWLRWRLPAARIEPQAFVGDQMTHGGQKGFGMTKHGRSGHATRSPRFRFLQKLEAQKNDRKDRSRIKDPKPSVEELFHPRKPT